MTRLTEPSVEAADPPSRRTSQLVAILLAALSLGSIGFPPFTPLVAAIGLAGTATTARRTGSKLALCAAVVCGLVLVLGLVIDLFLLGGHTVGTFQRVQ